MIYIWGLGIGDRRERYERELREREENESIQQKETERRRKH